MKPLAMIVAVVIAAIRPFMPPHAVSWPGSYEAIAHVVVGSLIGAWLVNRQRWLLWTVLPIGAVEVVCAVGSFFR
jgi:hypothetical protein